MFPIFDIGFLLLAVPTYLFLFRMFAVTRSKGPTVMKTSISAPRSGSERKKKTGWWKAFRESTFYTAVLLISAFIFVVIIPDLIILFTPLPLMSNHLRLVSALLCREISFVVDASIYVMTMRKVKTRVQRMLCIQKCCSCCNRQEVTDSIRSQNTSIRSTEF